MEILNWIKNVVLFESAKLWKGQSGCTAVTSLRHNQDNPDQTFPKSHQAVESTVLILMDRQFFRLKLWKDMVGWQGSRAFKILSMTNWDLDEIMKCETFFVSCNLWRDWSRYKFFGMCPGMATKKRYFGGSWNDRPWDRKLSSHLQHKCCH